LKEKSNFLETEEEKLIRRSDGVPSIDCSSPKNFNHKLSTSHFLCNENDEEEVDRLSNITEMFNDSDELKFRQLYNKQGHYSAIQSIDNVFFTVSIILL
jgi:hypothetical protein